jgi:hypothetical protein
LSQGSQVTRKKGGKSERIPPLATYLWVCVPYWVLSIPYIKGCATQKKKLGDSSKATANGESGFFLLVAFCQPFLVTYESWGKLKKTYLVTNYELSTPPWFRCKRRFQIDWGFKKQVLI